MGHRPVIERGIAARIAYLLIVNKIGFTIPLEELSFPLLGHSRSYKTSSPYLLCLIANSMIVSTALHRRLAGAALSLVTLVFLLPSLSGTGLLPSLKSSPSPIRPLSAGNATLGFQTIQVINLPRVIRALRPYYDAGNRH